jgi:hypothetical protein
MEGADMSGRRAQRKLALAAVKIAETAGVAISIEGSELVLEARCRPPEDILDALSRAKTEIILLLRPGLTAWSAEDWLARFDEHAAILEFDAGQPRELAELQALGECVLDCATSGASELQFAAFIRMLPGHIDRGRLERAKQQQFASPAHSLVTEGRSSE